MWYDDDNDYCDYDDDNGWSDDVESAFVELFWSEWHNLIPEFVNAQKTLPYKVIDDGGTGLLFMYGNLGFIYLEYHDIEDIYKDNREDGFWEWLEENYRDAVEEGVRDGYDMAETYASLMPGRI